MSGDLDPKQYRLILASSSPRRRQLLELLGLPFDVQPADVLEDNHAGESPQAMALRLSQAKAHALCRRVDAGLVVAADTLVYLDGDILGKPADPADAVRLLRRLRDRPHQVFSGLTLMDAASAWERTALVETAVWMRNYSDAEIAAYVASGDPLDKAGAYAIQHPDLSPVASIDGCYANVMGLPLCHLYCLLREAGSAPDQPPLAACDGHNQRRCRVAADILSRGPASGALGKQP